MLLKKQQNENYKHFVDKAIRNRILRLQKRLQQPQLASGAADVKPNLPLLNLSSDDTKASLDERQRLMTPLHAQPNDTSQKGIKRRTSLPPKKVPL